MSVHWSHSRLGRRLEINFGPVPRHGSNPLAATVSGYRTIVADPPWDHSDGTGAKLDIGYKATRRPLDGPAITTRPPYPVMSVVEIASLPVRYLAAESAHLYLWTTNRYLRQVWDVAEHWDFRPVCVLTWCKAAPGFLGGGTFPSNTEFCLFAVRGVVDAKARAAGRWFQWPRRVGPPVREGQQRQSMHSAKPEAFLDMVESVSHGPYLEMFARRQRLGWDTWGNEALEHVSLTTRAEAQSASALPPGSETT